MRIPIICVLGLTLLLCAPPADAANLNNQSKRFTAPDRMLSSDWTDPAELQRVLSAAVVRVPTGKSRSRKMRVARLPGWAPRGTAKLPAVVYMHGCGGVWDGTHRRVKMMADLGFVVVAPASFAREKYAQSCDPRTHQGGMYRDVLRIRQADAAYAVQFVRSLPYVDQNRVILMGLSEGGITAATYRSTSARTAVTHRIVEGWTCHAGWSEYKGLNAGRSEPVFSIVSAGDPWFQTKWTKGHCGVFMSRSNGSESIVYRSGKFEQTHEFFEHRAARLELIRFLTTQGIIPE